VAALRPSTVDAPGMLSVSGQPCTATIADRIANAQPIAPTSALVVPTPATYPFVARMRTPS
jgi:hypothetical protein